MPTLTVTPDSLSPVLKQNLVIQFESTFPNIADLSTYRVEITGENSYERELNIVEWDDVAKQMIVKFNGAPSGSYSMTVEGPDGFIGVPLTLTTILAVDTITPLQGSALGGTLLTITGGHFGNVPTDNPVKVGDNYCLVESTSDAEIKCRISVDSTQDEGSG